MSATQVRKKIIFLAIFYMCIGYTCVQTTYKYYGKEMNLSLRLRLWLLEVNQDREVWPPKFPINKCWVPTAYQTSFCPTIVKF